MPSLSLVRLIRCSPTRHSIKTGNLAFSLPCLSPTEEKLLYLQLDTVQSSKFEIQEQTNLISNKKISLKEYRIRNCPVLMNRYSAIAQAYNVPENDSTVFYKLCEDATSHPALRSFVTFKSSEVLDGLEWGTMFNEGNAWLNLVSQNKKPEIKSINNSILSKLEFMDAYLRRLQHVMDKLGMPELQSLLDEAIACDLDFNTFCDKFYTKMLSEYCGILNLNSVEHFFKSNRFNSIFINRKDPINMLRTYYILNDMLEIEMNASLRHIALLGRISSLDMLLALNMLEQLMRQTFEEKSSKDYIISNADNLNQLFIENQFIWAMPISYCSKILEDIGFSNKEIIELFTDGSLTLLRDISKEMEECRKNEENFTDVMRNRLILLRKEGTKLGVGNSTMLFKFIFNWEEIVRKIDEAELGSNLFNVWFGNKQMIRVDAFPLKNNSSSSSRYYMMDYFGIRDKEDIKRFKLQFSKIPYAKDVPLRVVVDTLEYLHKLGFSKEQIRKGFPVLFYGKKILNEFINKEDRFLDPNWKVKDNALCLLHYAIEAQQNFSFTLIYTGLMDSYEEGLSEEFLNALPEWSSFSQSAKFKKDMLLKTTSSSKVFDNKRSFHTSSKLNRNDQDLRKVRIFHFQNPFTLLNIHMKLREVQQYWDPGFNKEEFLTGAKYAVAAITQNLEDGDWQNLRGLLTRKEFKRLQKEVETEWSDVMRQNVTLQVDQIDKILISGVRTQQIVQNKYCDIDVLVMGVKDQNTKLPLVLEMEVRLHREYTEGCLPDWMVTRFKVRNWDKQVESD